MVAPILAHSAGNPSATRAWLLDRCVEGPPTRVDMVRLSSRLSTVLTADLIAATETAPVERMLLAALGRAVARTMGAGQLVVRVDPDGTIPHTVAIECLSGTGRTAAALLGSVQAAAAEVVRIAEVAVSYRAAVAGTVPGDGHRLELHARMGADVLYLDWWYDSRSFDRCTVEELTAQFPLALIEITSG